MCGSLLFRVSVMETTLTIVLLLFFGWKALVKTRVCNDGVFEFAVKGRKIEGASSSVNIVIIFWNLDLKNRTFLK